jgi:hypothetical protein
MSSRLTTALLVLALAQGCDPQGSSPVPQPVPGFVRQSTPELTQTNPEHLVVGLPGAVAGEGRVHVEDPTAGGSRAVADSSSSGTFSAVLAAAPDAELTLRFETEEGISDPVTLRRDRVFDPPPALAPANSQSQVVTPPDAQGQVSVSNDAGPGQSPLIAATPDVDVIVSNGASGEVVSSKTDADGLFTVKLGGAKGDPIHILLVDPESTSLTSDFLSYQVP